MLQALLLCATAKMVSNQEYTVWNYNVTIEGPYQNITYEVLPHTAAEQADANVSYYLICVDQPDEGTSYDKYDTYNDTAGADFYQRTNFSACMPYARMKFAGTPWFNVTLKELSRSLNTDETWANASGITVTSNTTYVVEEGNPVPGTNLIPTLLSDAAANRISSQTEDGYYLVFNKHKGQVEMVPGANIVNYLNQLITNYSESAKGLITFRNPLNGLGKWQCGFTKQENWDTKAKNDKQSHIGVVNGEKFLIAKKYSSYCLSLQPAYYVENSEIKVEGQFYIVIVNGTVVQNFKDLWHAVNGNAKNVKDYYEDFSGVTNWRDYKSENFNVLKDSEAFARTLGDGTTIVLPEGYYEIQVGVAVGAKCFKGTPQADA